MPEDLPRTHSSSSIQKCSVLRGIVELTLCGSLVHSHNPFSQCSYTDSEKMLQIVFTIFTLNHAEFQSIHCNL